MASLPSPTLLAKKESINRDYIEPILSQQTIERIALSLKNIEDNECIELQGQIESLIKEYESYLGEDKRSLSDILKIARVPENALRRIKSEKAYHGPNLEACIRIGLAIGCDNIEDIDLILSARGFEALSYGQNLQYTRYRSIVKKILIEDELPVEDRVKIFIQFTK